MKISYIFSLLLLVVCGGMTAQPTQGLLARYNFDNCTAEDVTVGNSDGITFGSPTCECGVGNDAMKFDGIDDYAAFYGSADTYLEVSSFTIAFYFKPLSTSGIENLFSKRAYCDENNIMSVRLNHFNNTIEVELAESSTRKLLLTVPQATTCWQHLAFTYNKETVELKVYVNGELKGTNRLNDNINSFSLLSTASFTLGTSPCVGNDGSQNYYGLIDEMYLYSKLLNNDEIKELFQANKGDNVYLQIQKPMYIGETRAVTSAQNCYSSVIWVPTTGVSDPTIANPVLSPSDTTTYYITFVDNYGCMNYDTLTVNVIDPDDFPCGKLYLAKAFTPNGDGLNDVFYIDNYPIIDKLVSFDIFDRWGGKVFSTDNTQPSAGWDGTSGGKILNADVYVYRIRYECNGKEFGYTNEVSLMR